MENTEETAKRKRFFEAEAKLNRIDEKMKNLENRLDGKKDDFLTNKDDGVEFIAEDIEAYRRVINELSEIRKEVYRFSKLEENSANFQELSELREFIALLSDVKGNANELMRQCDYLKETKDSLGEIGENERLTKLVDTLKSRMEELGGYDEKIRAAADSAMSRVSTMEEILSARLKSAEYMEGELLTSMQALKETADTIGCVVKEASKDSTFTTQETMIQLSNNFNEKLQNMEKSVDSLINATNSSISRSDKLLKIRDAEIKLNEKNEILSAKLEKIESVIKTLTEKGIRNLDVQFSKEVFLSLPYDFKANIKKIDSSFREVLEGIDEIEKTVNER